MKRFIALGISTCLTAGCPTDIPTNDCSDAEVTVGLQVMCPTVNVAQLEERIDVLLGLCERGDTRFEAFGRIDDLCSSQDDLSIAVACTLCEGTLLNRIWPTADADEEAMCPSLSQAEIQIRVDYFETVLELESSRSEIRDLVGITCNEVDAIHIAVECGLCYSTLFDRIWPDR